MCFRNPRTQQERRVNGSQECRRVEIRVGDEIHELRVRIRGKRSLKMLVEAWDDLPRQFQRSWKEHRGTQYKAKDVCR
jgi:alpha-glucuronidase